MLEAEGGSASWAKTGGLLILTAHFKQPTKIGGGHSTTSPIPRFGTCRR